MAWIKRTWKAHEADEWTKEDWFAIILSPLSFILITFGLALSLFGLTSGFIMLVAGVIVTALMFWIIDPKLNAISSDYESKQHEYLKDLENIQKWENK